MKNMKLSLKLAVGFGFVIAIAILLGGMAVVSMTSVKNIAEELNKQNMPALAVANNVERTSLQTMYEMRGYAYTEDTDFLEKAEAKLASVIKFIDEAYALGAANASLGDLKTAAEQAKAAASDYGRVAKDTAQVTVGLEKERVAAHKAAADYMAACNNWLKLQNSRLDAALARSADPSEIKPIVQKINIANDIIDVGNNIIIGTWESQFRRSPEIFNKAKALFSQVNAKLAELRAMKPDAEETRLIDSCAAAGQGYDKNMETFLAGWLKREDLGKQRAALAEKVLAAAQSSASLQLKDTVSLTATAASSLSTASFVMIVGLSLGTIIGIFIAYFITQSIAKPVQSVANSLSEGSDQVASASMQISSASQSLAEGASEQAASLEETSASLEEISSMTKRNAENAVNAKELANETRSAAEEGSANMEEMNHAMADIQSSSDNIAKIIKTIDEIAFQTNILALNAAVEAARAGEAGMGFAVVADEVRNLAQRSAQAAKETAEKIEDSIRKSANGVQISSKVTSSLTQIVTKARQVDELVAEIATASREQSQGLDQVNTAVTQMDKVTQTNAASAEESASASEELNAQAATLREIVSELQLLIRGSGGRNEQVHRNVPAPRAYTPKAPAKKSVAFHQPAPSSRPALGSNRPALGSSKKKSPQDEIPLEDSFKDF